MIEDPHTEQLRPPTLATGLNDAVARLRVPSVKRCRTMRLMSDSGSSGMWRQRPMSASRHVLHEVRCAVPAAAMVRFVLDHGLLRVRGDQSPARGAGDGLWLEETTRMKPEDVALEMDEDNDGGTQERVDLPLRHRLIADVAREAAVGRATQLGVITYKPPEFPGRQAGTDAITYLYAGQHRGAKRSMCTGR